MRRPPKQNTRNLLQNLDEKLTATNQQVRYITSEMSVNGAKGLKEILTEQHQELKQISGKVDLLWTVSEKVRTKAEAARVLKRYIEARPWLHTIVKSVIGKIVKKIVYASVGLVLGLIGIDQIIHLAQKIITLFSH